MIQQATPVTGSACSDELRRRIEKLIEQDRPRYLRLWAYYRNPMRAAMPVGADHQLDRPYRQAQEWGLPTRITGMRSSLEFGHAQPVEYISRKEVVIENDIAWRIETMIDYLFGRPIVLNSAAALDEPRRCEVEQLVRLLFAHNGGITFLQQLALMGAVYGFVDVLVKLDAKELAAFRRERSELERTRDAAPVCSGQSFGEPSPRITTIESDEDDTHPDGAGPSAGAGDDAEPLPPQAGPAACAEPPSPPADDQANPGASQTSSSATLDRVARLIRFEIVEPTRALPLLSSTDYRVLEGYAQVSEVTRSDRVGTNGSVALRAPAKRGIMERFRDTAGRFIPRFAAGTPHPRCDQETVSIVDLITDSAWYRYEDETLVAQGANSLGRIPLVHIQNTAAPFQYSGNSDVEPLIPLQDELNTRLSDRAYRITMQSARMYLGKGIENFTELPIGPGRMWITENEQAEIIEFGGDGPNGSEDSHISDIRQALDKTSAVTAIAAGAIKGRIGHLTSAAALRVTLFALLAKTERKRTSYGEAILQMCELALAWLDVAGVFATTPQERRFEIHWPSPIPENEAERVRDAAAKLRLGVPQETVLRELGY